MRKLNFIKIHWLVIGRFYPETFVTSAIDNKGVDEILEFVNQSIKKYTI